MSHCDDDELEEGELKDDGDDSDDDDDLIETANAPQRLLPINNSGGGQIDPLQAQPKASATAVGPDDGGDPTQTKKRKRRVVRKVRKTIVVKKKVAKKKQNQPQQTQQQQQPQQQQPSQPQPLLQQQQQPSLLNLQQPPPLLPQTQQQPNQQQSVPAQPQPFVANTNNQPPQPNLALWEQQVLMLEELRKQQQQQQLQQQPQPQPQHQQQPQQVQFSPYDYQYSEILRAAATDEDLRIPTNTITATLAPAVTATITTTITPTITSTALTTSDTNATSFIQTAPSSPDDNKPSYEAITKMLTLLKSSADNNNTEPENYRLIPIIVEGIDYTKYKLLSKFETKLKKDPRLGM